MEPGLCQLKTPPLKFFRWDGSEKQALEIARCLQKISYVKVAWVETPHYDKIGVQNSYSFGYQWMTPRYNVIVLDDQNRDCDIMTSDEFDHRYEVQNAQK